ncbi:Clavaminate synthase-like protein [Ramicandelaber brevisporus]|nr:Clavaminate synthase-like protein [Ramicandelaber brevisporus]
MLATARRLPAATRLLLRSSAAVAGSRSLSSPSAVVVPSKLTPSAASYTSCTAFSSATSPTKQSRAFGTSTSVQRVSARSLSPAHVLGVQQNSEASSLDVTFASTPSSLTSSLPYVWLRDHCPCPACIHPSNRQKLHSSGDISLDVAPRQIQLVRGNGETIPLPASSNNADVDATGATHLEVTWTGSGLSGGSNDHTESDHVSRYPLQWLYEHHMSDDIHHRPMSHSMPPHKLWDASTFTANPESSNVTLWHAYGDIMQDERALLRFLHQMAQYGLAFIHGIPDEDQIVAQIAERMGPIKETFYGRTWNVRSEPQAKNIAYTDLFLGYHMDLLYFEAPPGIQFLHCLKNSVTGGASIFVDGFRAVDELRRRSPADIKPLTDIPVSFHYDNDGHHLHLRKPTVVLDDINETTALNYGPPFQGTLELTDPSQATAFYRAFKKLDEAINHPSLRYELTLQPGECAVFANRRVLHGRRSFDASSGHRHLKGTYVGWDEFKDRYRVLRTKLGL